MFDFIKQIADIIVSFISFFINLISMIIYAFLLIPKMIVYLTQAIGFLPVFVGSFVVIFIFISLLFTIINHWGN